MASEVAVKTMLPLERHFSNSGDIVAIGRTFPVSGNEVPYLSAENFKSVAYKSTRSGSSAGE